MDTATARCATLPAYVLQTYLVISITICCTILTGDAYGDSNCYSTARGPVTDRALAAPR